MSEMPASLSGWEVITGHQTNRFPQTVDSVKLLARTKSDEKASFLGIGWENVFTDFITVVFKLNLTKNHSLLQRYWHSKFLDFDIIRDEIGSCGIEQ